MDSQLTKLRLSNLYVCPHVQHVTLKPVDDVGILLKLARIIPSDESCLEHDLLDDSGNGEGRDVGVVSVRLALCGYGPVLRVLEGGVGHQDHGLVRGGTVSGNGNYLLGHLIDVNLLKNKNIKVLFQVSFSPVLNVNILSLSFASLSLPLSLSPSPSLPPSSLSTCLVKALFR